MAKTLKLGGGTQERPLKYHFYAVLLQNLLTLSYYMSYDGSFRQKPVIIFILMHLLYVIIIIYI
jgi:hypothetical protein